MPGTGTKGSPGDGSAPGQLRVSSQEKATHFPPLTATCLLANGKRAPGQHEPLTVDEAADDGASFKLWREVADLPVIARFTIDGEPASKSRPRFTGKGSKKRAYTPEETTAAEQVIGWTFRKTAPAHQLDPAKTYGVMACFFTGTRQRRDVDNMLKLVLDGLNKVAWPDDSQVVEVAGRKTLTTPDEARTEVLVYHVGWVQEFVLQCAQCQREFPAYQSTRTQRFCSKQCSDAARRTRVRSTANCLHCGRPVEDVRLRKFCSDGCRLAYGRVEVACTHCGIRFTKQRCHVRKANYCSSECAEDAARQRRKTGAQGTCETCGGPTSKKTYRQCQGCRSASQYPSGKALPISR